MEDISALFHGFAVALTWFKVPLPKGKLEAWLGVD